MITLKKLILESEDEFKDPIEVSPEWNTTYLRAGSTITSDMWKDGSKRSPMYILGFEWDQHNEELLVELEVLYTDYPTQYWNVDFINKMLKPEFQVTDDNNLTESEDEFNVTPSKEWGKLQVGDTIFSHMWNPEYIDVFNTVNDKTINWYIEKISDIGNVTLISEKGDQAVIWIDILNQKFLKPEHQLYNHRSVNESEDEFNVTPDEQWNYLTVRDTITPDMWEQYEGKFPAKVQEYFDWLTSQPREIVRTYYDKIDKEVYWWVEGVDTEFTNDFLKPQYQVTDDDLSESEDEFNDPIEVSPEFNITYLEPGDKITYDMLKDGSRAKKEFDKYFGKDAYIELIDFKNGFYSVRQYNSKNGVLYAPYQIFPEWYNEYTLNPQYQLDIPLGNRVAIFAEGEEDEFNVTPSGEWNVDKELKKEDTITPDMWNIGKMLNDIDYETFILYIEPAIEQPLYISDIDNKFVYVAGKEDDYKYPINWINKYLKQKYQISSLIENLSEQEDEFNVTPDEKTWNSREFKVGDTFVAIENQRTPYKIVFIGKAGKARERFDYHGYYHGYTDDVDIVLFELTNGRPFYTGEKYLAFPIDHFNNKYSELNGAYVSEFMNEQEDEFNVDAPKEWNIKDLGINSYLDSTNRLGGDPNIRYEIKYFRKDPEGRELAGIIKQEKNEYSGMWNNVSDGPSYWSVDFINRRLKPGFEVVYGYTAPKQLDESDDEFNITPSVLWNLDLDKPVNITITKEFDVTNRINKTTAILIETTLIKTSVAELQEESGENYNYDEITVKNINDWINENSEVVIALFDMEGTENESWSNVDKNFNLSNSESAWYSNKLNYDLVDMDISVEIPESNLNESDEDFNITPNETWNTIEVGDIIEPYMWLDPKKTSRYLLVGNYGAGLKLKRILSKEDETLNPGDEERWSYNDPNVIQVLTGLFNDKLKPEYRFNLNESESDEDFNITPSEDWGYLDVGDTLDHTNLIMQDLSKKYIISKIEKHRWGQWLDVYLDVYKYNPKLKDWEFKKTFSTTVNSLNDTLKPGFKIQAP